MRKKTFRQKIFSVSLVGALLTVSTYSQALFQGLNQPIDARGWAMGAALVAQTRNSSGVVYNPAILSQIPRKWQVNYTRYVLDIQATNALVVLPAPWRGNLGAMIGYLDYGNFTETDAAGNELGGFDVSDLALRLGYGLPVTTKLSAGLTATFVNSNLADYRSQALLGSVGLLYYDQISTFSVGLAYTNFGELLGGYINDTEIIQPALMAGISKKLAHLPMVIAADLMHYRAGENIVKVGGEFLLSQNLFLRWGTSSRRFNIGTQQTLKNFFNSSSIGGGLALRRLQIDLSWLSLGHAGGVFALSLAQNL